MLNLLDDDTIGDGVGLHRLGTLAHELGVQWKVSPVGQGRAAEQVADFLGISGVHLYSVAGNAAMNDDGTRMARTVLNRLKADDYVITLKPDGHPTARSLDDGTFTFARLADPNTLAEFHSDTVRAANADDVDRVISDVLIARFAKRNGQ